MDKSGGTRIWKIWNVMNVIHVEYGKMGCTMISEKTHITEGLGGRTLEQQVELKMNSKINKKKDGGSVENIDDISNVITNQLGFEKQMKAFLLKDGDAPYTIVNRKKVPLEYDANTFVQRKYNGHRCTVTRNENTVTAYSSGGKPITSINHILQSIRIKEGQKIDGELYIHGLSLQKIGSKVRKQNVTSEDLKLVMFDSILDKPFKERYASIPEQYSENVLLAETIQVENFEEVSKLFFQFRAEKYEGAMLRHGSTGYESGRRSKSIFKIKKLNGEGYYDDEFEIVRILRSAEGWARLVCITEERKEFKVSAPGNHYEKTEMLINKGNYIGKYVKVEYPELTDANIPSQPVAIMLRDKENE